MCNAAVAGAARRGGILRGALFWRWDIQVYLGVGPGEYGVRPDHSTFDIIRNFATRMRAAVVATPPRKECELGCWVPAKRHHFETCAPSRSLPSHPPPPPSRARARACACALSRSQARARARTRAGATLDNSLSAISTCVCCVRASSARKGSNVTTRLPPLEQLARLQRLRLPGADCMLRHVG